MDKYFYFYTKYNVTNYPVYTVRKDPNPLGDAQDEQHWQIQ